MTNMLERVVLPLFPRYSHWRNILRKMKSFLEGSNISNIGALGDFVLELDKNRLSLQIQSAKLFEYLEPSLIATEQAELSCTNEDEYLRTAFCCAHNLYKGAKAKFGAEAISSIQSEGDQHTLLSIVVRQHPSVVTGGSYMGQLVFLRCLLFTHLRRCSSSRHSWQF
eukprot:GHVS01014141.1.p1 GENE.GHVS01014141.1~~GHVS01014141.1.p1  ORF type:complete len:167 (-),score=10.29 GHVS01014141.1:400-900(-)